MSDQSPLSFAKRRSAHLGIFRGLTPTSFEDPFVVPPLASGSPLQNRSSGQGSIVQLIDGRGGIVRMDSGIVSGGANFILLGPPDARPALIDDPGVDGSRWYLLWIFRVTSTPDNQSDLTIGFRPTVEGTEANAIFFGVDGVF